MREYALRMAEAILEGKVESDENEHKILDRLDREVAVFIEKSTSLFFGIRVWNTDDRQHKQIYNVVEDILREEIFETTQNRISDLYHDMDEVEHVTINGIEMEYCYGYSLIWFEVEK